MTDPRTGHGSPIGGEPRAQVAPPHGHVADPCRPGPAYLSVELPFDTTVASVARKEIGSLLGDSEDYTGSVSLVCSELVTNAYRHGSPPILLKVWMDPDEADPAVEITVTDGGTARRSRLDRDQGPPDESGRGQLIIGALTVGFSLDVGRTGTRAWCRLPAVAHPTHCALPAPCLSKESRHGS